MPVTSHSELRDLRIDSNVCGYGEPQPVSLFCESCFPTRMNQKLDASHQPVHCNSQTLLFVLGVEFAEFHDLEVNLNYFPKTQGGLSWPACPVCYRLRRDEAGVI